MVTFAWGQGISTEFLTTDSFTTGSLDFSEVALMALALTLVIVAAEIDLSVASVLALSSALMADLWNRGLPLELIMPICLVAGALCGAFNGWLVTRLGLPSLAVTIGTLALFRGLAYVVIGDESVTDFPVTWTDRGFGNFAGTFIPNTMVLFAILAVALRGPAARDAVRALDLRHRRQSGGGVLRRPAREADQADPVRALGHRRRARRHRDHAAQLDRRGQRRRTASSSPRSPRCCSAACRSSAAAARSLGVILALLLLGAIQKALLLSESISSYWIQIVTGALLVGSVLGPNLARRAAEARRRRSRQHPEEGQ